MDLISKVWDIQGITRSVFDTVDQKEIVLKIQNNFIP